MKAVCRQKDATAVMPESANGIRRGEDAALSAAGGYLSRCRPYRARQQRERRATLLRIDYEPSKDAAHVLAALAAREGWTHALNRIVVEWAQDRGQLPE